MKDLLQKRRVKIPADIELKDKLVGVQRVVKVTKGGRAFGFSAIVVVGDENSIVGIGLGKSKDVSTAIAKAIDSAKKNLVKVPVHKGTLPHEQFAKFGGAKVLIKPASNGTGVKAGGAMRSVLESAGVKDVLAKSKGSSNPHNLVKATMLALLQLRDPLTVSRNRGIKMEKVLTGNKMEKIKIKQVRSRIGRPKDQKRTLDALGLNKINKVVEHNATPQIMGMVNKVNHLIKILN